MGQSQVKIEKIHFQKHWIGIQFGVKGLSFNVIRNLPDVKSLTGDSRELGDKNKEHGKWLMEMATSIKTSISRTFVCVTSAALQTNCEIDNRD